MIASATSVVASSHPRNDVIPAAERGRLYREISTTPAVATSSAAVGSTSTMSLSFELKNNMSSQLDTSGQNPFAKMQNN